MFAYYLQLALRSLRRNKVLTALMVLTLAVGIGACITTLTVLRLLSGDPLPHESARLFAPQVNYHAPIGAEGKPSEPQPTMAYVDAMALLHAHKARRQMAMALTPAKITPASSGLHPFFTDGVMTTADFFAMFDVPFRYGGGWSEADGRAGAHVAVIADFINDKLFGGADSVGRSVRINNRDYRVVGVLRHWAPQPRFYALGMSGRTYGAGDGVFMPLETAIGDHFFPQSEWCFGTGDFNALKTAPCRWLGVWVQLQRPGQARAYHRFLANYAEQQVKAGRLRSSKIALPDLMQRLRQARVVPDDAKLQAGIALGFLLICVVNTVGLLLAKCLRRRREIGVRRALGASRRAIFAQFLVEAAIIGIAGGLLGLVLVLLGLWAVRHQPSDYATLAQLDATMLAFTFVVALAASLVAGVLPAWRACAVAPAPQLKSV